LFVHVGPVPANKVSSIVSGHAPPPPPSVVVVVDVDVGGSIVVEVVVVVGDSIVVEVVVLDVGGTVVVVPPQSQFSKPEIPMEALRHVKASVALGLPPEPLRSQMQTGSHVLVPTAARRMKRQSVATGPSPLL